MTDALPRSLPAAEGVSAEGVSAWLDALAAAGLQLHSFMLLRHGRVIAEGWWAPYAPPLPHMLFSLSKSFTSTAVGLAVHEGRLSVDDPVVSFFPEDLPGSVGPNLSGMRVRHLLTMGTGHDKDTSGRMREVDTWVRGFLRLDVEHAPGSKFVYNSGASYMLSAIVQKVTGLTLLDYLTPRVFEPLGIEGATWESSPQGINAGGWGLSLKTEDIARFGQLYLRQGCWQGRQLVPEAWVLAATSVQIRNGDGGRNDWAQGYGYQFWRCRHNIYRGDGAVGQFCIVMPEKDAVLAITGGTNRLQAVLDSVWDHLLPAIAQRPGDDTALRARLAALTLAPTVGTQREAPGLASRRYALAPNEARLEALALDITERTCQIVLTRGGRTTSPVACGFGEWQQSEVTGLAQNGPLSCAGHAVWEPGGTLRLDWYGVRTPFGATLRITPGDGGITVHHRANTDDAWVTVRGACSGAAGR